MYLTTSYKDIPLFCFRKISLDNIHTVIHIYTSEYSRMTITMLTIKKNDVVFAGNINKASELPPN